MHNIYYFTTIEKNLNRKKSLIESNLNILKNSVIFNPFIFGFILISMVSLIVVHEQYEYKNELYNISMTILLNIYTLMALFYYFLKNSLISLSSKEKSKNELFSNFIIKIIIGICFLYVFILSLFVPEPAYYVFSLVSVFYAFRSIDKIILKSDFENIKEQLEYDSRKFNILKEKVSFVIIEKSRKEEKQIDIFENLTKMYSLDSLNKIIEDIKAQ